MKILVYGAGVQGSVYAARLIQAGHDVSVLARGVRLKQIRDHGLVLRELTRGVETSTPAHVVERLDAEDRYDLVIVSVRRDQLQDVLAELAANHHVPTFLFLLNNATGFDHISHLLGRSRVLAGFPTVGGSRLDHVIHYVLISQQPTTLGELDGALTERLKTIRQVLQQAGFPVAISGNIDAWLKTHVVFIIAIAGALCLAGGDSLQLARVSDLLSLMGERSPRRVSRTTRAEHPGDSSEAPRALSLVSAVRAGDLLETLYGIRARRTHHCASRASRTR